MEPLPHIFFDDYQEKALSFALDTALSPDYLIPMLAGEVGELASIYAKAIRDQKTIDDQAVIKELGDILWGVAVMANHMGVSLSTVAMVNVQKLESRQRRGTISGSGDNR